MKKYCALIVSCLLVLVSFFLSIDYSAIKVGKGNGKDVEVSDINEMSNILKSLNMMYRDDFISNYNLNDGSFTDEEVEEITSVTLEIDSAGKSKNYVSSGGDSQSLEISYNRKLNIYFGEDAIFYSANMDLTSKSSSSINSKFKSQNNALNIEFQLYFSKDIVAVRFQKYHIVPEDVDILENLELNVWYKADEYAAKELLSLNESNISLLAFFGNVFEEKDYFIEKNGVYSVNPESSSYMLNNIFKIQTGEALPNINEKEFTFDLSLDISSKKTPIIKDMMTVNIDRRESGGYGISSYTQTVSGGSYDIIKFKNINNTVVKMPKNLELKEMPNE